MKYTYRLDRGNSDIGTYLMVFDESGKEVGNHVFNFIPKNAHKYASEMIDNMVSEIIRDYELRTL